MLRRRTGIVHMGTRKSKAGWGCSKMYMAKKVSMMPYMYPTNAKLKQLSQIFPKLLIEGFFLKAWSMSNLRQKEMKKPGSTISPRPTILQATFPYPLRQGKDSLIGRSKFLATVTMTSVPQTQKISQKNKAQSKKRPVLVVLKLILLRATIEKNTPKTLFKAQCLVAKQSPTGIEARIKQTILALDNSNFLHSSISCKKPGIFHEPMITCHDSGKDNTYVAIPEIENTIDTEKYALTIPIKMYLGKILQRQQIPNKNAEATKGNRLASFILITASFYQRDLLKLQIVPSLFLDRREAKMHPMQTHAHVLIRSCAKIGKRSRPPATLVARRQMQAGRGLRIGRRCSVIDLYNCIQLYSRAIIQDIHSIFAL